MMIFGGRKRKIVKALHDYIRNPRKLSPLRDTVGVRRSEFEEYLQHLHLSRYQLTYPRYSWRWLGNRISHFLEGRWNRKTDERTLFYDIPSLINDCIDDGYIIRERDESLRVSSRGHKYISPLYWLYRLLEHWAMQHAITALISGVVGALLSYLVTKR